MNTQASGTAEVEIVGVSRSIRRIRELIDHVAETGFNVIVCGETGVGKELVVSSLYQKSNRLGKPFVKVNCAALPDTLLESEMFGYERGAFTGAIPPGAANSSRPMKACSFWTRSATCPCRSSPSCCTCFRVEISLPWARRSPSRRMSG
jgi:transcriptional regulator of acetoin/glycerol metabolism